MTLPIEEIETTEASEFERLTGGRCHDCGRSYCSHQALFSVAMGFKNAPRCLSCLAAGLKRDATELRDDLIAYIRRRDCYWRGWLAADRREGTGIGIPDCLVPIRGGSGAKPQPAIEAGNESDESWDAGDMACGELVLALRLRLNALASGSVLRLTARDPAAPEDLPAWCRLTGHTLVSAVHPEYTIRKRER